MLAELAAAVHDRRVRPAELVEAALARIEAHNPAINAVVALRADEAMAEAAGPVPDGPLAGVPVLVKDLTRVAGMRTTLGSPLFADAPVDTADDPVVARLRAAGAIVVGKTNTPAFGHTAVTANELFGPTRNPWNPERSPGGSSGGSAAALSAGMAPIATTTDGGGSVRIPASLCGLVGYKPTIGVIGRPASPRWMTFSTSGATASTVADALTEARVLAGPERGDLQSLPAGSVELASVRPRRIMACRTLRADVDPAVEDAFDRTCAVLADELGLPVEVVANPIPADTLMSWFVVGSVELAQSLEPWRDQWEGFEPMLKMQVEVGAATSAFDYVAHQRRRYDLCAALDDLLGDDAVLVAPTVNSLAWAPEGPMATAAGTVVDDPSVAVSTPELNMTGHPGVSVPMGIGPDGVPLGLQVVAPRWRDGLALGVAAALEQAQPWPASAPGYDPFPVP